MTTTILGNELFEYLNELDSKFEKLVNNSKKSDAHVHNLVRRILQTETAFLQKYHGAEGKEPTLAFGGNGLPFPESLHADMLQVAELKDEEEFSEIGSIYSPEIQKLKDEYYNELSFNEYKNALKKRGKGLTERTQIQIPLTENGNLELLVRRDFYVEGRDEFAKNFPVFLELHSSKYQLSFNQLFSETSTTYHEVNKDKLNPFALVSLEQQLALQGGLNEISQNYLALFTDGVPLIAKNSLKAVQHVATFNLACITELRRTPQILETLEGGTLFWLAGTNIAASAAVFFGLGKEAFLTYLGVSAATNITSGLYEFGRFLRRKKLGFYEDKNIQGEETSGDEEVPKSKKIDHNYGSIR